MKTAEEEKLRAEEEEKLKEIERKKEEKREQRKVFYIIRLLLLIVYAMDVSDSANYWEGCAYFLMKWLEIIPSLSGEKMLNWKW